MSRGILQDFIQDPSGNAVVGASVEVFIADGLYTTQAALWDAAVDGNSVANPMTTVERGYFSAYADTAEYDLRVTTSGGTFDIPNVPVFDADELTDLAGSVSTAVAAAAASAVSAGESATSADESEAARDEILALNPLQTVATLAELQALPAPTAFSMVTVANFYDDIMGGGGDFYWKSNSSEAAVSGLVVIPDGHVGAGRWKRAYHGELTAREVGARGDGITTSDGTLINLAATKVAGGQVSLGAGVFLTEEEIILPNYTELVGLGTASILKIGTADISGVNLTGKTNCAVKNMRIISTIAGTAAYVGGVKIDASVDCEVNDVEFDGMSWASVYLNNASRCTVTKTRSNNMLGTVADSADIMLYRDSNDNIITENFCFGGGYFGIMIQDPYTPSTPYGNIVTENEVAGQLAYGIAQYVTTRYDSKTLIALNKVRNVSGSALAGASGAGIFVQSGNGTIVANNQIDNCCIDTTNFETLGMAGLSVALGEYGGAVSYSTVLAYNTIRAQRGPGVYATASDNTIVIDHTTVWSEGVAAVRGEAIIAVNCEALTLTNSTIEHVNPNYYALKYSAVGALYSDVTISGSKIRAGGAGGMIVNQSSGGSMEGFDIRDNKVKCTVAVPAYNIADCDELDFTGNKATTAGQALIMTNCLDSLLSANRLKSTYGTYNIIFTGTMTGTIVDESNKLQGIVQNDGGALISMYGSATPASGIWAVGDRVIQSVSVVGNPKGWRCTTAPNTWTSEGNL